MGLINGALVFRYRLRNHDNIKQETQRLENMGLEEGKHFTVKMPEEGRYGFVYILKEGLVYAVRLSEHGSGRQQELAAEFISYILEKAKEEGEEVYEKAKNIIGEGKARGSLRLEGFEGRVVVGGGEHIVKVIDGSAEFKKSESSKLLLRIRITAEMDGVRRDYTITFSRLGRDKAAVGRAYAKADAPGGREADAERFSALIKALAGEEPKIRRMKDGTMVIRCHGRHLKDFMRYAELADAIERWLKESRVLING